MVDVNMCNSNAAPYVSPMAETRLHVAQFPMEVDDAKCGSNGMFDENIDERPSEEREGKWTIREFLGKTIGKYGLKIGKWGGKWDEKSIKM